VAAARHKRLVAIAACLAAAVAGAADLGTLFTTPEERARLDRLRRGEPPATENSSVTGRSNAPVVTGYVKRSDGRNTVWIDGTPVAVGKGSAALLDPRAVDRPVPAEGAMHVEGKPARQQ
jgi:hypothetical protein